MIASDKKTTETAPLVSVIVPTRGRPQYLPRAVESALRYHGDDVEVIVVPNGPDESWRQSLEQYNNDCRVKVSQIDVADGNYARNHGMSLASGKYIRFLDDDDYLLPDAICQLDLLEEGQGDFCSGIIQNESASGEVIGLTSFPDSRDFVCAVMELSGFTLPSGNIIRRKAIGNVSWDINVRRLQDAAWMIDLAASREWKWIHCPKKVGAWVHHEGPRISSTSTFAKVHAFPIVDRLLALPSRLEQRDMLNNDRVYMIAQALWYYAHLGFPYRPFYWASVAKVALNMAPGSRPPFEGYRTGKLRHYNPLLTEWVLYPVRRMTRLYRDHCK